jgi:hypothetical protein
MSIDACLQSAVAGKELTQEEARRLKQTYDEFVAANADRPTSAPSVAKQLLSELLHAEAAEKKRRLALTIKATKGLERDFATFAKTSGKDDVGEAALQVLENFNSAGYTGIANNMKAIVGMAQTRLEGLLYEFRRGAVMGDKGRHNLARLDNVVREAFGEGTGDAAAKNLARAWADTAEWLRIRFNDAGGTIGKLENWGMPQFHDAAALLKTGRDGWKAAIMPRLDTSRMVDPMTGRRLAPSQLDTALNHVYDSITMGGWNTREASRRAGTGGVSSRRADHRFLVFRNADDWLAYQKDFGNGDAFQAMMGHINGMARDIAIMEKLGPSPNGTIEWMRQTIEKEGAAGTVGKAARLGGRTGTAARNYAAGKAGKLTRMWESINGDLDTPEREGWAMSMGAARQVTAFTSLGSAVISSVGDVGTQMITRAFNGLPVANVMGDITKAMTTAGRREAVGAGMVLDEAMHVLHTQARMVGDISGPEITRYITDRVLTISGLTPWTRAGRHSFGLSFMREFAEQADKAFDGLHPLMQDTMRRAGIGPEEWNVIRSAPLHGDIDGGRILRPKEIDAIDPALAERYLAMVHSETEHAVPTGSHRSHTFLVHGRPGTFWGEVSRNFAQFKGFAAHFAIMHGMRVHMLLASQDKAMRARGAAYAGGLLISTTLLGALAWQLKSLSNGRDPRRMDDAEFWGAALLQGGGLGIMGDFLFADVNRFGGGLGAMLAGPLGAKMSELRNFAVGNALEGATGEDAKFGREAVKFGASLVPGGSIWYLRLAYQRMVVDQLQWLADPEANKAFKRRQQWWTRSTGQEFFWEPGKAAPTRGPDFGPMLGSP